MRDKPQRIEEMLHLVCQEFSHLAWRTAWHLSLAGWEQCTFGRWAGCGATTESLWFTLFSYSRFGFIFSWSFYLGNQLVLVHPTPVLPVYLPPLPNWSSKTRSRGGRWKGYWFPHIHTHGLVVKYIWSKGHGQIDPSVPIKTPSPTQPLSVSVSLSLSQTIKQTCRVNDVNSISTTMFSARHGQTTARAPYAACCGF